MYKSVLLATLALSSDLRHFSFVVCSIYQRLQEAESRNQELTSSISQGVNGLKFDDY